MGGIKKLFKFQIDGYDLVAQWDFFNRCVIVEEPLTHIRFHILETNDVVPQFNWMETNEHRISVAKFLETTNLYDLLKPAEAYESTYEHERTQEHGLDGLTYEHDKKEESAILQKIHEAEILRDTEYRHIYAIKDK